MKNKVIKVIHKEIDRLFKHFRDLRADVNHNTRSIEDLSGYLTEAQSYIGTLLLENNTDERLDALENRLQHMETYLVNHVDPQLSYDHVGPVPKDILGSGVTVKFEDGEVDVQSFNADDEEVLIHADDIISPERRRQRIEADEAARNIWLRINPTPMHPEPHTPVLDRDEEKDDHDIQRDAQTSSRVNPFYHGPQNKPAMTDTFQHVSYRYHLAQSIAGSNDHAREELLELFAPLSESELQQLTKYLK